MLIKFTRILLAWLYKIYSMWQTTPATKPSTLQKIQIKLHEQFGWAAQHRGSVRSSHPAAPSLNPGSAEIDLFTA